MKRVLSFLLAAVLILGIVSPAAAAGETFQLIVPESWELLPGDSRTLDYAFSAGVTNRMLRWESSAPSVATVDAWGRVTAVKPGKATITATQIVSSGNGLTASAALTVKQAPTGGAGGSGIVHYAGVPAKEVKNLQKIVTRYASSDASLPDEVRGCVQSSDRSAYQTAVTADGAT